ncbi:MAG: PDZ domain-containing protein, partial [Nitrosopumilaceae archaeon]
AEKAGLHGSEKVVEEDGVEYTIGGDIILSVDGKEVRKISDILIHLQRAKAVGDDLMLEILRDGRTSNFTLVLGERPIGE